MKYRSVLLAGVVFLVTGIIASTVGAIALVLSKSAHRHVVEELDRSRAVFQELQLYRQSLFRSQIQVVADEPRVKAVVSTADVTPETVLGVARDLRRVVSSDLFLLTDGGGLLLADASNPGASGQDLASDPLVARALADGQAAGIWIHERHAYQMQAKRLAFGSTVVGTLVIGFEMDNRVAETVYRQTGNSVIIELDSQQIASSALGSHAPVGRAELASMLSTVRSGGGTPVEVSLTGVHYLAVGGPMPGYTGEASLRYVVLGSLDEALAPGWVLLRVVYAIATVSLLVSLVLATAFAKKFSRPIDELVSYTRLVAAGHLTTQVRVGGATELQTLGHAMNGMVGELRALKEGLEARVSERTRELTQRGRDMRLVLDNVAQGFLTVDARGYLAQERSAVVDRWFGPYSGEITFAEYLSTIDRNFGLLFEFGLEALNDDILPRDLCLDQLPRGFRFGGREFCCSYSELDEAAQASGLLIVISDITDQLANARKEAEQREVIALFQGLIKDRSGYMAFFEEADRMLESMTATGTDLLALKCLLHTLKGNAGAANLHVLSDLCGRAEDDLGRIPALPGDGVLAAVRSRWLALKETLKSLLGERDAETLEIDPAEIERLCDELQAGAPVAVALERLRFLRLEPVERAFGRLAKLARELGERLGKGDVAITINARGVRMDARRWSTLWTELVHLVRNAVDHGLEPPDERRRAGKSPRPQLSFDATITGGRFVIGIGDDGRGIDWAEVKQATLRRGLPCASEHDLTQALFSPEFTTRKKVTGTSGRGIGLTAVRARVQQLGGTISVDSQLGSGTLWCLSFPLGLDSLETVMAPILKQRTGERPASSLRG